jgi:hypothetical protein
MFCYSITKMENNNLEQRYAIKCVKLRECATNTQESVCSDSLSRAQVFWWQESVKMGKKWWKMNRDPDSPHW